MTDDSLDGALQRWDGTEWTDVVSDTGWVNITPASGVAGTLHYRRVGQLVVIDISVTGTFGTAGNTTIAAAGAIPSALRIGSSRYIGSFRLTGAENSRSALLVSTDGSLAVEKSQTTAATAAQGQFPYLLG